MKQAGEINRKFTTDTITFNKKWKNQLKNQAILEKLPISNKKLIEKIKASGVIKGEDLSGLAKKKEKHQLLLFLYELMQKDSTSVTGVDLALEVEYAYQTVITILDEMMGSVAEGSFTTRRSVYYFIRRLKIFVVKNLIENKVLFYNSTKEDVEGENLEVLV